MAGSPKQRKILQPYGDMFQQLSLRIRADLHGRTNEELEEIKKACTFQHKGYGRSISRIKDTVHELACYEMEGR